MQATQVQSLNQEEPLEKGMAIHCSTLAWEIPWTVKDLPAMQQTWVQSLVWEDPLEKGMATHSSILA